MGFLVTVENTNRVRLRLTSAGRRDGPFAATLQYQATLLVVHLAPAANLVSTALAADAQVVFVQRAEADTEATGFPRHSLVWLQITRVALGVVHVVSGAGLEHFFCSSLNSRTTLPGEPTTSEPSGISLPSAISVLAPMMQCLPIFAPLSTTALMPIRL